MNKNIEKYNSYRSAMEQVDAAISARFFLEAITIEESILTDRLLRFSRDFGLRYPLEKVTLGREIDLLRNNPQLLIDNKITFFEGLHQFWIDRCECLHQIAKSEPGKATRDFIEIYALAEKTAIKGKLLVKEVGNWAARYKRVITRTNKEK